MAGPQTKLGREIHEMKYRLQGESFEEAMTRVANALKDNDGHFKRFREILLEQRFLPGGRIQAGAGAPRQVTLMNCFVSGPIEDSMESIMDAAKEAAFTMRMGGGIGYNFSNIRPKGSNISSLDSQASGPVSYMQIFDSVCKTISSAGHRRGAQMGILRVDHPDIEEFIRAKQNSSALTAFNISLAITDEFMRCVEEDTTFKLRFNGVVHKAIRAKPLWEEIMRSTYDWAEPGVFFIDTANRMNNISYCEEIIATNPCGEICMGPHSACLLGSFNLTKYVYYDHPHQMWCFAWSKLGEDIPYVLRAMDNVNDRTIYPLEAQKQMALAKRRLGIGITGLANALERLGHPYGSPTFLQVEEAILKFLANNLYIYSAELAREKGSFPLYSEAEFIRSPFFQQLDSFTKERVYQNGMRNSHLLSIAPTGTISISADNISSGIEPTFLHEYERIVQTYDGPLKETVKDYALFKWGMKGKTTKDVTVQEHLNVLLTAQKWVDQAISKTVNVPHDVAWQDFQDIYMDAWKGGAKGITTFRDGGKRQGILQAKEEVPTEPLACLYDPATGERSCGG